MAIVLDGNNLQTNGLINSLTAQNSTSGTSIDFTGIPAGVKRVTMTLSGVSISGTADHLFQLGAGSITSSGYLGAGSRIASATAATTNYTAGFGLNIGGASGVTVFHGSIVFTLIGSNVWAASGVFAASNANSTEYTAGSVTLSGTLDRVRLTTSNGTDTFTAGKVNVLYE